MLYTASIILCMVGPVGSGGCAPASKPLDFTSLAQCQKYVEQEVSGYKAGEGLESMRPHLPSMREGKLKITAGCYVKFVDEWLGVDMPEVETHLGAG
jgi:hypothetical protein